MTQTEQAVLLWPLLALAARTQQILSYAAVVVDESKGKIKSVPSDSGIAFLVVSQQSGMPGERFPENLSPLEIKIEQGKVFLFDWSGHDKPRPHDFQAARSRPRGAN